MQVVVGAADAFYVDAVAQREIVEALVASVRIAGAHGDVIFVEFDAEQGGVVDEFAAHGAGIAGFDADGVGMAVDEFADIADVAVGEDGIL